MTVPEVPFSELLSDIVDHRGRSCSTSDTGFMPLIATNCVTNDRLYPSSDTAQYVSRETYDTWVGDHPQPGDLLFVWKGAPGRVAMVPEPVDFCIAQDMVVVRADPNRVYPKYLFAALRSPLVQARIAGMHGGAIVPHFTKGNFDKLSIPLPVKSVQVAIGDFYFQLSTRIEQNERTVGAVARLASTLDGALVPPPNASERADTVMGKLQELRAALVIESRRVAALRDYLLPRMMAGDPDVGALVVGDQAQ